MLVGHSMGGVLARLMVSSSGDAVKPAYIEETGLDGEQLEAVLAEFGPFLEFEPMPQVTRAVFIAAPIAARRSQTAASRGGRRDWCCCPTTSSTP